MFAEKPKNSFPYSRLENVFPSKVTDLPEFKEITHNSGVPFMIKETTSVGAFSPIKLPVVGSRNGKSNGLLLNQGTTGWYWSSTINNTVSRTMGFNTINACVSGWLQ